MVFISLQQRLPAESADAVLDLGCMFKFSGRQLAVCTDAIDALCTPRSSNPTLEDAVDLNFTFRGIVVSYRL